MSCARAARPESAKSYQIRSRRRPCAALLCALGGLALACARRPAALVPGDGSLTVAIEAAPSQLDPRVAADQASSRAHELIFDGLVEWDRQARLAPALAERWEELEGGRRWRFHLRRGVRFHDGRPCEAADVVWSLASILDGTVATSKRAAIAGIRSVVAIDAATVEVTLAEPSPVLLSELTSGLGVVPRGASVAEMNAHPIGTGPYRFVGQRADRLELAANPAAFRGPPAIARLVLKAVPDTIVRALELRKGSAQLVVNDLAPDAVPPFRDDPRFRVVEAPGASFVYLGFNFDDRILATRAVRRAIALAIDRPQIVRSLWRGQGVVSDTIFAPGHWARDDSLPRLPFDPVAARALLDQAGFPDPDGDGPRPRFRLVYKTSTNEQSQLQAQAVQAMLAAVGIEVEIRTLEFATLFDDIRRGSFQLFSLTRTAVLEPNLFRLMLHSQSVPPTGQNRGRYANPAFDAAIDAAARTDDLERRRALYAAAQRIFADDLPYVILLVKSNVAVMAKELGGYEPYPSGAFTALRELRWEP